LPTFPEQDVQRLRVAIRGAVQGVGFRPFVYRLADELDLNGWVNNTAQGVFIEVEGSAQILRSFLLRLDKERPPLSSIQSLESSFLDPVGYESFEIRHSEESGEKRVVVLPDIATCPDCLREVLDAQDRRYRYPFTNCTNCGPRFSIVEALPYDRPNTTMKSFAMCAACRAEYEDPADRRFHAQPNACPQCGPQIALWDADGRARSVRDEALRHAAQLIREGHVLAVKGLGGFHLVVDARDDDAVRALRERKHREEKPFALMFPSLLSVEDLCEIGELEQRLLLSPESPIVLLPRKASHQPSVLSSAVAPGNPCLGVMLPYTPLHHLLLRELGFAVVATSGNRSDEPICTDEAEALERLKGIADFFLIHDRPIVRHVDDSIVRVLMDRELVLRRARGYAPLPVPLRQARAGVLAVGAHLKNTIAVSLPGQAVVSQHIGDLDTAPALEAFRRTERSLRELYGLATEAVVCDEHPDYLSTQFARGLGVPVTTVQHHYAHVRACMAENEIDPPVLGVSWDGTGYGPDGTVWGGEFLAVTGPGFSRAASLRPFRLPGGEQAVKEPRRAALGLLYELEGEAVFNRTDLPALRAFSAHETGVLRTVLAKAINAPLTSSAGRLFDAIASLIGLRQVMRFEGQAAMELEFLAAPDMPKSYAVAPLDHAGSGQRGTARTLVDWGPMVTGILDDVSQGVPAAVISAKFHNALAESVVLVAQSCGIEKVALTGGCFQNRYLTERAVLRLRSEGFRPYWHQRIPPNDGGISLGQLAAASSLEWAD